MQKKIKKGVIPFGSEIVQASQVAGGVAGTIALNFCHDIACSTGIYLTKEGHPSLIRTLDWGLKMAPVTMALTRKGIGGNWVDITYPGFAGTVTALGPHFTAAINRAPMPKFHSNINDENQADYKPPLIDKVKSFLKTIHNDDLSPVHLLRQTFEECTTFDEAVCKIATTKTNCSVIISITGKTPDEAAIIYKDVDYCAISTFPEGFQRLSALFENHADVRIVEQENLAATNHWPAEHGLPKAHARRKSNSMGRKNQLINVLSQANSHDPFDLLNLSNTETDGENIVPSTVLAAELTPATGKIKAIALEDSRLVLKPAEFFLSQ